LVAGVLLEIGDGPVRGVVVDHEHLTRERHPGEDAIQARDDRFPLVVGRDDDRDPRRHTRTPAPRRFQMSTTGTSGCRSAYVACGVLMMSRLDSASTSSSAASSGSAVT